MNCTLVDFVSTNGSLIIIENGNPSFRPFTFTGALDLLLHPNSTARRLLSTPVHLLELIDGGGILFHHGTFRVHGDDTTAMTYGFVEFLEVLFPFLEQISRWLNVRALHQRVRFFQAHSPVQNFINCFRRSCAMTVILQPWRYCRGTPNISIYLIANRCVA